MSQARYQIWITHARRVVRIAYTDDYDELMEVWDLFLEKLPQGHIVEFRDTQRIV